MKHTLRRSSGLAALAIALSVSMAACGSDDDEDTDAASDTTSAATSAPTDDMSSDMGEDMSSDSTDGAMTGAGAETFGPACSAIPKEGAGSFNGMATEPVATAASANPLLTTLVTAVKEAGLVDTLNGAEALTVFAPTNDAFAKVPEADLNALLADKATLTKVLTHHVIGAKLDPTAIVGEQDTLNNDTLTVEGDTEGMTVAGDNAEVLCGNIPTANATVYVIDTVLMPQM